MPSIKKYVLGKTDSETLYRVTNAKLDERPELLMVVRHIGNDWIVESSQSLRGYRACQTHLRSRVRQYEFENLWPHKCDLGIGIFEKEKLVDVLVAINGESKPVIEPVESLPLDDILGAVGLTRGDVKK